MDFWAKMMVRFMVGRAVQMIELSCPQLKGKEKYLMAVQLLKSWGVKIDPEIEEIINEQVATLNAVGVFKKPGLPF